jgi:rhamnose transport system permease protein
MKRYERELSVAGILALLLVMLAVWAPLFFEGQPLLSLVTREAPLWIMVCGVAMVIIGREIDISVGSQFAVCLVVAGLLADSGWPLIAVALASVATGALLGSVNGLLIAGLGLPSIVVTLATMVIWREGLRWLRQGVFVNLPDGVQWLGLPQAAGQWLVIVTAIVVVVLLAVGVRHIVLGRWIYAVGSDAEAARLAGIPARVVKFGTFAMCGALVGLASVLNLIQAPQVDPKSGTGLELKVIAAAVVGGIAINGGRGNLIGAVLGLLLLACVAPALTHLHLEPYWEKPIQGLVIIVAVAVEAGRRRNKNR